MQGYMNFCMYFHICLWVRTYFFVSMSHEILSNPRQDAPVDFLYPTVEFSKIDTIIPQNTVLFY